MSQKKLLGSVLVLMVAMAGWLSYTGSQAGPRIEAESGSIHGPMKVVDDGNFSGSGYIQSSGNRGYATYRFHVDQHGMYKISARAYGHSDKGNSFFVQIDDKKTFTWDLGHKHKTWNDVEVTTRRNPNVPGVGFPTVVELDAGYHVIKITERERNSGLDYFEFQMVKPLATASFLGGFGMPDFIQGALALCLIALSIMTIGLVNRAGWLKRDVHPPVDARMNALEKRLSDMQEVILSMDEQLKRMEYRFDKSSEPELAEKD